MSSCSCGGRTGVHVSCEGTYHSHGAGWLGHNDERDTHARLRCFGCDGKAGLIPLGALEPAGVSETDVRRAAEPGALATYSFEAVVTDAVSEPEEIDLDTVERFRHRGPEDNGRRGPSVDEGRAVTEADR